MKILLPDPAKHNISSEIRSSLSFFPYYKHLQERMRNPKEQFADVYRHIAEKLESSPELLQPFNDPAVIEKHEELFQLIASTIIPLSADKDLQYFALGTPYKFEIFFYSDSFSEYFSPDSQGYISFPPERPFEQLQNEFMLMAYRFIFRKFFHFELRIPERRTNQWMDKATGLRKYSRIHIDESFIDIKLLDGLPPFPEEIIDRSSGLIIDPERLHQQFPLSLFSFEGFIIRRSIADVTTERCVIEVKNSIIEMQSENPLPGYEKLRSAVETMIGIKNVEISLSPFLKLNDTFIFYNKYSGRSILLKDLKSSEEKETAYKELALLLNKEKKPLYISNLKDNTPEKNKFPFSKYLKNPNDSCYIVVPLFDKNELIGMMEATAPHIGELNNQTIKKLEPVYTFFEMMCRNYISQFKTEIESLILERYTALLPVVEWKFMEEAWLYLKEKENNSNCEIGVVSFDQVYPFFGAIDVKDSSINRNLCFQKDILAQLDLIADSLQQLKDIPHLPDKATADTLFEKNKSLRKKAAESFLAEDEIKINEFLGQEIKPFFDRLSNNKKISVEPLRSYFASVDPDTGRITKNRKAFDESIGKINETISRFLENEQQKIQQFYPHYFEKFRTDGVEYNIYMGQSFTPKKIFDTAELKKIRLWQLSVMIEIARITQRLEKEIPVSLQTTQLILIYSKPICISFRMDERRFDVEGAESIRFEILKKRIDKVKIKNTGERLTKPGTIAIVYSHHREIEEYDEYFNFFRENNFINEEIEWLDLEDVQSISGLKAIRVKVNVEPGRQSTKLYSDSFAIKS